MGPHIAALPVAVPFIAAGGLVIVRLFDRRWVNDVIGAGGIAASVTLCAILLVRAAAHPFAYWMGGWRPVHSVTIGISLSVDPLGAGMAMFAAVLVLAAFVYAVRYFDAVSGLFQSLMLLFGAAMVGFCLTGDLFNIVVFFELMGAAAYALTGYLIEEKAPIQGAINFAITNSIAGYAMFIGLALLYARTGALNMAQIGHALDGHRPDALVIVAMALLFLGFLTKAAAVPVHFWLADAHAVAPVPICVLFSGVMIELGVYAVARLYWVIFAGALHPHEHALRIILVCIGAVTALLGAGMCFVQRHIKRLLAFSSISHIGMFVCGVGLLEHKALAGVAVWVVGHGLNKAALFMCAGVLMHRYATIDEYDLHGRGREVPIVGVLLVVGALLLSAIPPFTAFAGKSLIEESATESGYGWLAAVFTICSAVTSAAVLRVAARVFLGWGPAQGPGDEESQENAAQEDEDEMQDARDHTPPMMVIVPAILLVMAMALAFVPGLVPSVESDAARFTDHAGYATWVLQGHAVPSPVLPPSHITAEDVVFGVISALLAIGLAALGLFGRPLQARVPSGLRAGWTGAVHAVRGLHSGHVGDYVAWWTAAASLLGAICLLALT